MKTLKEINEEIAALENLKNKVPSHNFFGENNTHAIEAQIEVLKEKLTEDEIELRWHSSNVREAAMFALYWMNEEDGSPSEDWSPLAQ